jgi:hypothetical protein
LIASGVNVAFGAPRFFQPAGDGDSGASVGELSGTVLGEDRTLGVVNVDGASLGAGFGDGFFFRRGDALGDVVAEGFSFCTGGATDGVGNSLSEREESFFFGEGLGDGDALFVKRFFFRGVGVGVGVWKIFLIVSASDGSAAGVGARAEAAKAIMTRTRTNITKAWTAWCCDFLKVDFVLLWKM